MIPEDSIAVPDQPFWQRPLTVDFKGLLTKLAQASTYATFGKWDKVCTAAIEAAGAVGIKRTPEQLAGVLLQRALIRATFDLLRSYLEDFSDEYDWTSDAFAVHIEKELNAYPVVLNEDFLERPRSIHIVKVFQHRLASWLLCRKVGEHNAEAIAGRLPAYFVYALHQELRTNKPDYGPLLRFVKSEVADAWRRERSWHAYRLSIERELDEPLFGEGFCLRQIFIWPNAYFLGLVLDDEGGKRLPPKGKRQGSMHRIVVDLKEALDAWLETDGPQDPIRVLSGDPGAGKSAFIRMYAQYRIERGDRVFIVPLHRLNVMEDLGQSLDAYCDERDDCPIRLLSASTAEQRLLLILDGLDELSQQGRLGPTIAGSFVDEVIRKVSARNETELRVRVLISGRPIVVENAVDRFRDPDKVLYLLPYRVGHLEESSHALPFFDPQKRLAIDLRTSWWQRYGTLKGTLLRGLPDELATEQLDDLTSQPLLNYLLAFVYSHGDVNFKGKVCRNEIYNDLLNRVYARDWERSKSYKGLKGISREDFRALLEEMALTAWHEHERVTSVSALKARCNNTRLSGVLKRYAEHCDEGMAQLFAAFYFRKSLTVDRLEPTFEFTHKSFAEYLTACRIINCIRKTSDQMLRCPEARSNDKDALSQVLDVCGPAELSTDLIEYLQNELQILNRADVGWVRLLQDALVSLLNSTLSSGMPCECLSGVTFQEMARRSRNAEETLLVLHSCCAEITGDVSTLLWPTSTSAGEWIARLRGGRHSLRNRASVQSLNHLDFSGQKMAYADLGGANLRYSNLDRTDLRSALLDGAVLLGATLRGASLEKANCSGAHLEHATLDGASLTGCKLIHAVLDQAKLLKARLNDADLSEASLEGAALNEARLEKVNATRAILYRATLEDANLTLAKLNSATLTEARLTRATLTQAILNGANLDGALCDEARFAGAHLIAATMRRSRLDRAVLDGASLEGAVLEGASLKGASLHGANLNRTNIRACKLEDAQSGTWELAAAHGVPCGGSQTKSAQPRSIQVDPDEAAFAISSTD